MAARSGLPPPHSRGPAAVRLGVARIDDNRPVSIDVAPASREAAAGALGFSTTKMAAGEETYDGMAPIPVHVLALGRPN
jgi:hypothetical protein